MLNIQSYINKYVYKYVLFCIAFYSYKISEEIGLSNESLLLGHVSIILDMVLVNQHLLDFCICIWVLNEPSINNKLLLSREGRAVKHDGTLQL